MAFIFAIFIKFSSGICHHCRKAYIYTWRRLTALPLSNPSPLQNLCEQRLAKHEKFLNKNTYVSMDSEICCLMSSQITYRMCIYFNKQSLKFSLLFFMFFILCYECYWVEIRGQDSKSPTKPRSYFINHIGYNFQKGKINQKFGKNEIIKPKQKKKRNEMDSEEVKKHNEEKEKVKKLLAEYKRKVNKEMEKHVKEMEKDEKLKEVLREIEEAQAKHPEEKRKAAKSITEINAKHWDELYQGDIVLSVEQAQYLLDTVTETENRALMRVKRGAAKNAREFPNHKWPMLVPFSFDSTISSEMKAYIYEAVKLWNDNTCLNIVEDDEASPRIQFTNIVGEGCCAHVGMQSSDTYQNVQLEYPDCYSLGAIVHEIGHALGFVHEHGRYDRDSFVSFYPDNVHPEMLYAFQKETSESADNYQVPYDLGSVMHYHAQMFSINGQSTLVPRADASYINTIGQEYGPSLSDYFVINKHYCGLEFFPDGSTINTEVCYVTMNCDNDGFQNPDTCSTCICPQGYIGAKCQDVDIGGYATGGIANTCEGNILFATSNWQNINGQIGSKYMYSNVDYSYCHWQIFPDIGQTILIEVLDVGEQCAVGCRWGNTEIRTAANRGATGVRLCCRSDLGSSEKLTITATNGYALISVYSFYYIQRFSIRFRQY